MTDWQKFVLGSFGVLELGQNILRLPPDQMTLLQHVYEQQVQERIEREIREATRLSNNNNDSNS